MYNIKLFVSIENHLVDLLKQEIIKKIEADDLESFDVINVLKQPEIALSQNVMMTPTLLRITPKPVKRIIGDLSQIQKIVKEVFS